MDLIKADVLETVRAVRDFLNRELMKYDNWNHVDKNIKVVFKSNSQFQQCKRNGVGASSDYQFIADVMISILFGESATTRAFFKFMRLYTYVLLKSDLNRLLIEAVTNNLLKLETLSYKDDYRNMIK